MNNQKSLISRVLPLVLLGAMTAVADPISFSDGFEGATLDPFWTVQESNGTITPSTAQAHGGTKSAQFTRTVYGQLGLSLSHTFEAPQFGTVSVWFYDTIFYCYASFVLENTALGKQASFGIQDWDTSNYYYSAHNGSGTKSPRSVGWHLFSIASSPTNQIISLDGVVVLTATNESIGFNKISLNSSGPGGEGSYYYDDFSFASYLYPGITAQPQSQSVPPGSNATFTVTASGAGTLTYQWQFYGTNLAGATGSSLTIGNVQSVNVGDYRVIVTGAGGSVVSSAATLTLLFPPTVVTSAASNIKSFQANLNGSVNPNGNNASAFFEWGTTTNYGNTTAAQAVGNGTGAVALGATINSLEPLTTYHYRLTATNSGYRVDGEDAAFTTTFPLPPAITAHPQSRMVPAGTNAVFTVSATGEGTLGYQWQWNATHLAGATGNRLTITNVQPDKTGDYLVIVTNLGGSVTSGVAVLKLLLPPTVVTASAGSVSSSKATLNGTVNPNGTNATAFFQWGTTTNYGNTTATQAAGNGTNDVAVSATISNLTGTTTYHFRLVASNSVYRSNGGDAAFTTAVPPPVISSFSPVVGEPGTSVTITGTNLAGATVVRFNGISTAFSNISASQISAIVPAGCRYGPISVTALGGTATSSSGFVGRPAGATLAGPLFPPPFGCSFSESGSTGDGAIGRTGGATWYLSNVALANNTVVYWGATNRGVRLSFISSLFPEPPYPLSEVLTYAPSLSSLSNGVAVWTGTTPLPPSYTTVYTRFTLRVKDANTNALALVDAASLGFPPNVGGVLALTPGLSFQANLLFEASYSASGPFQPMLDFYDSQTTAAGTAYSSFAGGFYYENTKPVFTSPPFTNLTVNRNTSMVGPVYFNFNDAETGPSWVSPLPCTSTNQSLVANGNIQLTRTAADTAYFRIFPNAGQTGQTLITCYLSDGFATNSRSFLLTVNDPPTISNLPNVVTGLNAPVGPLPFTVADSDSNPTNLVVTASSSNPGLVPNGNIILAGSGPDRTVSITPVSGQFGTATITVTVSDGFATASDTFVLTVDDPPVISDLTNQVTAKNVVGGPYGFTITDRDTDPTNLVLIATSSNTNLVPDTNIVFGGSDTNRTVTITPLTGQIGTVTITVAVSDGYATNSDSFVLTVDDPPTISDLSDKKTNKNTPSGPHILTVGDTDTDLAALTLRADSTDTNLVPVANIVFTGSGSTRMVTITPANGLTGTVVITLTVSDGVAESSDTFTLLVNNPPLLTRNDRLYIAQGSSQTIGNTLLAASDVESPTSQITFTVAPGGQGGPPRNGSLRLNGNNLVSGSAFTQDDIDSNRLTYSHHGDCSTNDDFTFNVTDPDGGATPTGQYTTYTFRISITPSNHPPVAVNGSANVGLGATLAGSFSATDTDCPPVVLTFRVLTNGLKGTLTLTDASTGAFNYTASVGQTGTDTITFQVNDGVLDSVNPATFTFNIANQPPTALSGSATTMENIPLHGNFSASDPDQPPQTLNYRIGTNGLKGTAAIVNAATGEFSYTPNPGAIGTDSFTFIANDGGLDSAPGIFTITIRPNLDPGDVLITDGGSKSLLLIDASGTQFVLSSSNHLKNPAGVAFDPAGSVLVMDTQGGVIRINPTNGAQTVVSPGSNFSTSPLGPVGIAVERNGSILVADGVNGIVRVNPVSGAVSVVSSGGNLVLPEGVTVAANGDIYTADLSALLGQASRIVRINPTNGAQTVVSSGGYLVAPIAIALDWSGGIVVSDGATFAGGPYDSVLRIDPTNGAQTVVATNTLLRVPTGLGLASGGRILTANNASGIIVQVDGTTGAQTIFASGGNLVQPFGMAVVHWFALRSPTMQTNGQFRFVVYGEPGQVYTIQSSDDLKNWGTAGYVTNATGTTVFTDPASSGAPHRFYRARPQ